MMMTSNTTQGTSTVQGTGSTQTSTTFTATFSDRNPAVHEAVTDSTTERIMIFRNAGATHTFTVPTGVLNCDILMIGGGGGGGGSSGGGAGACIVAINHTLTEGTYQVYVGVGGAPGGGTTSGSNGSESYIYRNSYGNLYLASGGGGGGGNGIAGFNGGCGGGAGYGTYVNISGGTTLSTNIVAGNTNIGPTSTTTYSVMGNNGGGNAGASNSSGGGGGIGEPGATPGVGGNGRYFVTINGTNYNFRNHFANGGNGFGVLGYGVYYIGGGGGGSVSGGTVSGGLGGGGSSGQAVVANTGSGTYSYDTGGSGIIIIRYRTQITTTTSITTYTHTPTSTTTLSTTLGTPSIELVRGTQGDSNTDYKIGNYNGDFLVKSSVSGVDTDYLKISSTGAITNPTGTASWNTGSDRRIKENIARASYDKCYDNINKLELNRFNYIKGFNTVNRDITQLGFIAQEVYDIFPKAISTNGYYSDTLIIPDLLSIDVTQINYTLYGAVKKLMEINKDKEMRLKRLEGLLNISIDTSNIVIDTSSIVIDSSSIVIDSSSIVIDSSSIAIDTSNIVIDTSSIAIDTSNIVIDTSNIVIDTSNIIIDTSSNIAIDTSNIAIDTSSNVVVDTSSNVVIDITHYDILSSNLNI